MPEVVKVDVIVDEHGGKRVLKGLSDESKKTGTSFSEMGKDAKSLTKQLFEMDIQIRKTAMELERTGDTSLVKTINKQRRELNALAKVRRDVLGISFGGKDSDSGSIGQLGAKAGTGFGMSLIDSASKAMSSGGSKFVAAVGTAAAFASPFLGASIAAAVIGGVGLGGIAGGIAGASQDPRVKQAAKEFGQSFLADFGSQGLGASFVAPTVEALHLFKDAADGIAGDLGPSFDELAKHVMPLAQGLVEMVQHTLPGFKDALKSAEPVLNAVTDALPSLGDDLSSMFHLIASQPEGAAAGMHDLINLIGLTAKTFGGLIAITSAYYGNLQLIGEASTRWSLALPEWAKALTLVDEVGGHFADTTDAVRDSFRDAPKIETHLREIGDAATNTAEEMGKLKKAVDDVFNPVMDLDEATLRYQKGLIELKKELTEGKRTLAINSEEGIRNREAILDQIQAIKDLRDATATVPEKIDAANTAYGNQLEALRKTLIQLGYNKTEVNALIDAYKNIPAAVTTEFRYPGLLEAIAKFRELARLTGSNAAAARALGPGEGTFHQGGDTSGYGGGRASGGYMTPGMTYSVAESGTGVERVKMLAGGGAIVSNMDQWSAGGAMVGGGGGTWRGGGAAPIVIQFVSDGTKAGDMLVALNREAVRVIGGGDVQKTYGRNDR